MSDRTRRKWGLVVAGPLLATTAPLIAQTHISVFGAPTDATAGFVAGVGIALALLGLLRIGAGRGRG